MNGLTTEKFNRKKNLLSFITSLVIIAFTINLSLCNDSMMFILFYVFAAAASAWLVSAKGALIALLSSLVGWCAAFLLTEDPLYAILSISYVPFSLSIPAISKGKISRSTAIGIGTACVTLGTVATLLAVTYLRIGSVSLTAIKYAFPSFFKQVSKLLYESFSVSIAGNSVALIAKSNVVEYLNLIICLLPAVLSAILTLVGYIIAWLYRKLAEGTSVADIGRKKWALMPSPVTAVFFLIALFAVTVFDNVNVVTLTAMNIFIIILPVIFLTGLFTSISPKVTNSIPRPRFLRPLSLVISVFNGVVPFTLLCTCYGIYDSIKEAISRRKPKQQE